MNSPLSRRAFLGRAGAGAGLILLSGTRAFGRISPNERLNIGFVGTAGQAGFSLDGLKDQNIVALCDVDENNLVAAARKLPGAKTYRDFRRMMDQKDIDAVVVATPDHTHAVASVAALKSGRHVYCEKPLARTISETRIVTDLARKTGLVTQIGTQIHAGSNYRRVVELVKSGAIGEVGEVHVWVGANYGGKQRKKETPPVPRHLDWDLWLGPVEFRPYHPDYVPFHWRNWWHFGGGSLADIGCHYMDLPFWALDLHSPISAEADGPPADPESPPTSLKVRYEFPARVEQGVKYPPVRMTWYHGGRKPDLLSAEQAAKWGSGILFVGRKGMLIADYGRHVLLPEADFDGFVKPKPFIPDSLGHHREWVEAIKLGGTTTCRFGYSGPLTETVLLGNVAFRAGCKLEWDAAKMRATNCPEADRYIQHRYRRGWKI